MAHSISSVHTTTTNDWYVLVVHVYAPQLSRLGGDQLEREQGQLHTKNTAHTHTTSKMRTGRTGRGLRQRAEGRGQRADCRGQRADDR